MVRRDVRALIGLLVLSLAGCVNVSANSDEADKAYDARDYERALALYENLGARYPENDLLREKAAAARDRAIEVRLDAARDASLRGNFAAARAELAAARGLRAPDNVLADAEARVFALEKALSDGLARARALLAAGRADEAARVLATLGPAARSHPEGASLLARAGDEAARKMAAERAATVRSASAEAVAAIERGALGPALDAVDRARAAAGADANLAAEAARAADAVRAGFLRRSAEHLAAGRPASALLHARGARRAAAGPEAETALARSASELGRCWGRSLLLETVSDATGGRADPGRFTVLLREALDARGAAALVTVVEGGGRTDLTLSAEVTRVELQDSAPVRTPRVHEWVIRTEQEDNPAYREIEIARDEAELRLADAEEMWQISRQELEDLDRLRGQVRTSPGTGGRWYGSYDEATWYRMVADAKREELRARIEVEEARKAGDAARQGLNETPRYLERKVVGRLPYEVVSVTRTAEAHGRAVLAAGEQRQSLSAQARHAVRDESVEGRSDVGLADDPLRLPSEGDVAEEALRLLADRLASEVVSRVSQMRRSLIEEARRLDAAGDESAGAERYAAFLLASGPGMQIERANAARILGERFGFVPDREE